MCTQKLVNLLYGTKNKQKSKKKYETRNKRQIEPKNDMFRCNGNCLETVKLVLKEEESTVGKICEKGFEPKVNEQTSYGC